MSPDARSPSGELSRFLLRTAMKILTRGAISRQIGRREERRENDASIQPCGEGTFSDQPAGVSFHHGHFLLGRQECFVDFQK